MKRPLLAAALLIGAPALHAQTSSLTLWGIVDAWTGVTERKVGGERERRTVLDSGGAQASRWSVRGEEQLGGGLRVRFVLEQGISIDGGTITNVSDSNEGFNRNSYVALAGPLGEVRLGRMLTAYDALRGSINQLYDSSGFASTGTVWRAGAPAGDDGFAAVTGSDYLARGNNTVYYKSPHLGPIVASVSVSLGEGATTDTQRPRMITGHVEYKAEPLRIGYAFQRERYTTGDNVFHMIGGTYTFGTVRLVGNVQRQIDQRVPGDQKSDELQFGVDVPFGQATVALGYARAVTKNADGRRVVEADGISAMATYDLSKRTRLYAALRHVSIDGVRSVPDVRESRYGAGITHKF